jgi:hypothetical protein
MRVSVIDGLNLSFLGLVSAFAMLSATPYTVPLAIVYPALLLWLLLTLRWHDRWLAMLILPVVYLFAVFETLFMVVPYFNSWRADDFLARMDVALFGVNPTEWATRWAAPWLTEILYCFYLFYFPMPLILLGWMYARPWSRRSKKRICLSDLLLRPVCPVLHVPRRRSALTW